MTHRPYTPWLFLLPGLAICLVCTIFPFLNMIVLSFTDASALGGDDPRSRSELLPDGGTEVLERRTLTLQPRR